jgi:hypothetical protein
MASSTSLTTHCIVLPNRHADCRQALASLERQSEPANTITAIGEPSAAELLRTSDSVRWFATSGNQQIAALNAALASNRSDLVFLLRVGDAWTPDYLAQVRAVYAQQSEVDFVFCDVQPGGDLLPMSVGNAGCIDLGFSAVTTYLDFDFVGGPLSSLSMRRRLAERIAPLVDDSDWAEQPEACLVFAASLAGARKAHLPRPLVKLAPETPTFSNHRQQLETDFSYRLKALRLISRLARQLHFDTGFIRQLVNMEFESKAADDWSQFMKYCRSVQLHQSDRSSRRRILLAMYRRMKKHIRQQSPLTGRLRCWWLKQRLQYSTRLVA